MITSIAEQKNVGWIQQQLTDVSFSNISPTYINIDFAFYLDGSYL
ncbi:hypothetical protein ACSQ6I_15610 [Anabaena sp. WFMT]